MPAVTSSPKPPELSWRAQEVIKKIDERPHLVVRLEISGTCFPHRATEPFVRIVTEEGQVVANWYADVADDNTSLVSYFPTDLPRRGTIEFGYGGKLMGTIPLAFDFQAVTQLDRKRLPKEIVEVSSRYLKTKQRRD